MDSDSNTIRFMPASIRRIPAYFLERIIDLGCIWGLRHPEGGWALCSSWTQPDLDVYLFWSERRLAALSVQQEWSEFEPVPIDLRSFILDWLDDMIVRGTRIGLDWEPRNDGREFDSQAFKRRLCHRLAKQKAII